MEFITTDDILGKEAIDSEGEILGITVKLHIDKNQKKLVGLTIDQGFMKPDLYVGVDLVQNFGIDTIFLKKVNPDKFRGQKVFKHDGRYFGFVKSVGVEENEIKDFVVAKGKGLRKEIVKIEVSDVLEMGDSIILKEKVS